MINNDQTFSSIATHFMEDKDIDLSQRKRSADEFPLPPSKKRAPPFSEEQNDLIVTWIKNGQSYKSISKKLDVNEERIQQTWNRVLKHKEANRGIVYKGAVKRVVYTQEIDDRIVECVRLQLSHKQISEIINIPEAKIRNRWNTVLKKKTDIEYSPHRKPFFNTQLIEEIKQQIKSKRTFQQIAESLNLKTHQVARIWREKIKPSLTEDIQYVNEYKKKATNPKAASPPSSENTDSSRHPLKRTDSDEILSLIQMNSRVYSINFD